jgi:two-component system cell cycle sensor histidine kinase/response regulator CckA
MLGMDLVQRMHRQLGRPDPIALPDALRESEERFRGAFDRAPVGMALVAPDGRLLHVNRALCELTGYTEPELLGRTFRDITHPDDLAADLVQAGRLFAGEIDNYDLDKRFRHKDGRDLWVVLSASAVHDAGGRVAYGVGVVRDLTEAKQLGDQFRQAQKMEAVGQLAGGIAHDFNNLLTIVTGYSELLLQMLPAEDPARGVAAEIHKAGERSAALTRQLLAFSRRQVVIPRAIDLNDVVRETESMLRRLIGEDVRLSTELVGDPAPVVADPGQIEQVLVNLAVNARDAMPRGGHLAVETVLVDVAAEAGGVPPGPYVLLAVADTGVGMSPEVKGRVFEPFFTTKGVGKGTGLGLAVVHGVVTQAGGHIQVESALGRGTTFRIYLPRDTPSGS